jgi:hypothetical protein
MSASLRAVQGVFGFKAFSHQVVTHVRPAASRFDYTILSKGFTENNAQVDHRESRTAM